MKREIEDLNFLRDTNNNYTKSLIDKIALNDELLSTLHVKERDVTEENDKIKRVHQLLKTKIENAIDREATLLKKVEELQFNYNFSQEKEILLMKKCDDLQFKHNNISEIEPMLLKKIKHLKSENDKCTKKEKEYIKSENELRMS